MMISETVTLSESTCSQFGSEIWQDHCSVCDYVADSESYSYNPTDHDWYYDDEKEVYICYYCDLENANGASGAIVMEDMTDSHGESTNYVVGYWNREAVEFVPRVSVILDEVEGDDNEFVLIDVDVNYLTAENDGITAISFNQADALSAAAELMESQGYTGSYAIRISLVPVNAEDTLDYAITFDSLEAA